MCDQKEWETAWKCVEETFGQKVQILVNNAGVKAACGWKSCLEVNLYGTMIGSFLARDQMGKTKVRKSFLSTNISILIRRPFVTTMRLECYKFPIKGGSGGRVINIASMAGLGPGMTGFEGLGYPVSKCGMVSFTRFV